MKISYSELTEGKKNKILKNIQRQGLSIKTAAEIWNVSTSTINKIFTERFGSRERKVQQLKDERINQFTKIKNND
tara:strand:+ start:1780 stop:2004 length:225 start_codon:yes stop_codon:yes gene_type:complete